MEKYNIIISRCTLVNNKEDSPSKVIGFTVQDFDGTNQIYHEASLPLNEFQGKTDEECVELAFLRLSSSIATSVNKIKNTSPVVGSFYTPS